MNIFPPFEWGKIVELGEVELVPNGSAGIRRAVLHRPPPYLKVSPDDGYFLYLALPSDAKFHGASVGYHIDP